ncbi:cytochrome c [Chitinimonas sp.]|uniref:c-type cytochrome n=1 Tax=Chitinimonas sp. TaxID=1934313 RepID=UPI002F944C4E
MNARLALILLAGLALSSQAADLAAGRTKAEQVCAACHNADGNSTNPQYPVLAGQHVDYLRKALRDYQSGARGNAIMAPMAQALSKADVENVAAWFASQPSKLNMQR